jgi:RimJ/RimL family protein N-acetyltransferase
MTDTTEQRPRALAPGTAVPERFEIDEFLLRRYTRDDIEELHEAIKASYAEIHPWMPWCVEPVKIEEQRDFVERASLKWVTGEAFDFGIFDADGRQIGAVSLMDGVGPGGLEVGYWLRTDATGRGVMTRTVARLTAFALGLPGITRVEIHCDAANLRSAAVPERLGYRLDRVEQDKVEAPGETGRGMVWITP